MKLISAIKVFENLGKSILTASTLIALAALPTLAQDSIRFGSNVASGGNGCPPGTFSVATNGNQMSIIFDQFEALANPKYTKNASCNLRIPVSIPIGYTIQDIQVVSEGFADIPNGGSGAIDTKVVAGTKILGRKSAQFGPGYSATYTLTTNASAQTFNACRAPVNTILGLNTNLISRATNAKIPTTVNLSTQDISSQGRIQIIFYPTGC